MLVGNSPPLTLHGKRGKNLTVIWQYIVYLSSKQVSCQNQLLLASQQYLAELYRKKPKQTLHSFFSYCSVLQVRREK